MSRRPLNPGKAPRPAPEKPDEGRANAALGTAAQIDRHAQARRAAEKGSSEWHHHNDQLNRHMSHLQKVDSTMHANVRSILALQDRLHQSEQITMSTPPDERRERRADPNRREAITRDRQNLRAAKDMLQKRGSAAVVKKPRTEKADAPKDKDNE